MDVRNRIVARWEGQLEWWPTGRVVHYLGNAALRAAFHAVRASGRDSQEAVAPIRAKVIEEFLETLATLPLDQLVEWHGNEDERWEYRAARASEEPPAEWPPWSDGDIPF